MNINVLSNKWLIINGVEFFNNASTEDSLELTQHTIGWDFKDDKGYYNQANKGYTLNQAIEAAKKDFNLL